MGECQCDLFTIRFELPRRGFFLSLVCLSLGDLRRRLLQMAEERDDGTRSRLIPVIVFRVGIVRLEKVSSTRACDSSFALKADALRNAPELFRHFRERCHVP